MWKSFTAFAAYQIGEFFKIYWLQRTSYEIDARFAPVHAGANTPELISVLKEQLATKEPVNTPVLL